MVRTDMNELWKKGSLMNLCYLLTDRLVSPTDNWSLDTDYGSIDFPKSVLSLFLLTSVSFYSLKYNVRNLNENVHFEV